MENKKGTGHRPAPKRRNSISKIEDACLFLFVVFIAFVVAGQYMDNDRMLSVGVGIGFATLVIKAVSRTEEEDSENDI